MFSCNVLLLSLLLVGQAEVPDSGTGPAGARDESPHFNAGRCGDCHGRDLPEEAAAYGGLKNYYNGLCLQCHSKRNLVCRFHSDRIPREGGKGAETFFPLKAGRIYCLTCHDGRIQCVDASDPKARSNPLFLRGNPGGGPARFCFACHRAEQFRPFKVHRKIESMDQPVDGACFYCHKTTSLLEKKAGPPALRADLVSTCTVCHRVKDHPEDMKHLVAMKNLAPIPDGRFEEREKKAFIRFEEGGTTIVLPLGLDGMVQCTTCHDPHAPPGGRPLMLRAAKRDALCRACHGEGFKKDSK